MRKKYAEDIFLLRDRINALETHIFEKVIDVLKQSHDKLYLDLCLINV